MIPRILPAFHHQLSQWYSFEVFLCTIPRCTTGWKWLVCNKKWPICKDPTIEILYHRFFSVWMIFIGGMGSIWVLSEIYKIIRCNIWNQFFYVTLAAGKLFPNNIHRANYHFTYSKNLKRTR
jgi:hypothetical protein